ncbi:MAG: YkgJ family cysteine cluster protein [Synechocystis sp.]
MATWYCMQGCGACCNLTPGDRPDLADYLTPAELEHYLSLVGEGGWCINYDHDQRLCRIYEDRPRFCRVRPDTFAAMFKVDPADFTEFAIACCEQQIEGVYGPKSEELSRYGQGLETAD